MERRLAAILAADVVGYSRLMEQDDAGTLAALKGSPQRGDRPQGLRTPRTNRQDRQRQSTLEIREYG
jgi:hypothetical protein